MFRVIYKRLTLTLPVLLLTSGYLCAQAPVPNPVPQPVASISGAFTVVNGGGSRAAAPGVTVTLTGPDPAGAVETTMTDGEGHYALLELAPGKYTLEASEEGFNPWSATVTLQPGQTLVQDVVLQISSVDQQVEVRADETAIIATDSVTSTETVDNKQLDALPLPTQKFTEALSLVPGVLRTSEGKLSFNGQYESQGMLVVDSAESVDPISGSFSIPVPVDAIQSMSVYPLPESSAYGGFSGGLTTIETKAPSPLWGYNLLDFPPSFRGKNGQLVGIANWTPRLTFGGPLIKNKVNFTQEVTYEFRRTPVRGLAWPVNETTTRTLTSFTQIQFILSPRHLLNLSIIAFPSQLEYANINTPVPQTASADYSRTGGAVGLSDSYQFVSGAIFNAVVRYTRFDSKSWGQGPDDMQITPLGWGGNFFNTWSRKANQVEMLPAFQLATRSWHGQHEIKFGEDVLYRSYSGSSLSHPIDLLDQNGLLAESIFFQGPGPLKSSDTEAAEFIEDRWTLSSALTLNFGARFSSQSIGRDAAFAPRAGIAFAPGGKRNTVFRASIAEIYSHVPLLAADFPDNQSRTLSFFDPSGALLAPPITLQNVYLPSGNPSMLPGTQFAPQTSPRTLAWNVEVEHEIRQNLSVRMGYLDTNTSDLFLLNPLLGPNAANPLMALEDTGVSHYRQAQVAAHYRPGEKTDFTVSYTWSRALGDLNTLSDMLILFQAPVIRPNVSGLLPTDVPHRVLASGLFRFPWKLAFSPIVDIHSGFLYSNVDVLQNYVGVPDSLRFPIFFSMNIRVYREMKLRVPFREHSKPHNIRLGFYSINVTNHQNAHDVYNNVASPYFGIFTGYDRRVDGMVLDLVQ
jgi:Carboxypeptidase regulatory-like domain/TonB dependent receptor-like, beta-barrel